MNKTFSITITAVLFTASAAAAQDTFVGLSLTSDYITGNVSQSAGKPALQGYFETNLDSGVYFGSWMSQVDFSANGGTDNLEIDLYGGYRGNLGKVSYDLGYYRYYYNQIGFDSDELWLKADYNLSDSTKVGVNLRRFFNGMNADQWLYGPTFGLSLSDKTAINAGLMLNTANSDYDWNIGLRQQVTDTLSAKATYFDSTTDTGRFGISLSWDTSVNALFK